MSLATSSSVMADQTTIHSAIALTGARWHIPRASAWRSLLDIALDWAIICFAVWSDYRIGAWITVVAIFVIGNRQRALGNLLHEASHKNLSARRNVNDWMARIFLAPALFNDLTLYRLQHARHHAWLGDPTHDPDYLSSVTHEGNHWFDAYGRVLNNPAILAGSLFGHFAGRRLAHRQRLEIVLWWVSCETLLDVIFGMRFALLFFALWMIARGTVFHAITTFREMTDHYGLQPGGIFQYTREVPDHGFASILLHPHHNGYHLTHHLLPHIPYRHLPQAHAHLKHISAFNCRAIICDTYLSGVHASVKGWEAAHV
ncbi:fatty acid desaturase [Paraburkholderia sp. WC7.3g]|uniref:Fatty acid desaturase n=1 Tax=Paraburkholderia podalyriae TaxID=1938811 RepID=A0ABR7PI41_9BURK|nr:fatty acid desaturase [Paraburkholderia podalyriae]MBC8746045.1 fatty acid desaturase [Paraburkholderia podalyriae]